MSLSQYHQHLLRAQSYPLIKVARNSIRSKHEVPNIPRALQRTNLYQESPKIRRYVQFHHFLPKLYCTIENKFWRALTSTFFAFKSFVLFSPKSWHKKGAQKMLVKLTSRQNEIQDYLFYTSLLSISHFSHFRCFRLLVANAFIFAFPVLSLLNKYLLYNTYIKTPKTMLL